MGKCSPLWCRATRVGHRRAKENSGRPVFAPLPSGVPQCLTPVPRPEPAVIAQSVYWLPRACSTRGVSPATMGSIPHGLPWFLSRGRRKFLGGRPAPITSARPRLEQRYEPLLGRADRVGPKHHARGAGSGEVEMIVAIHVTDGHYLGSGAWSDAARGVRQHHDIERVVFVDMGGSKHYCSYQIHHHPGGWSHNDGR